MDKSRYNDIIQTWITEVENHAGTDAELTLKCCVDIIQYGMKTKDDALIAFGYYYTGVVYYTLNKGPLFYEAITNALSYLNRIEDWELTSRCYNLLGIASVNRGNIAVALDYYIDAIKYSAKAKADLLKAIACVNVGALYNQCGRYYEAIINLEYSLSYFGSHPELERYHEYMISTYDNIAKSYFLQGKLAEAKQSFEAIYENHADHCSPIDRLTVLCTEAMYYHVMGDHENCERCIAEVHGKTRPNMPIMDMFVDYYDYCKVLLERNKEKEFWHIMDILEPMVKTVDITNLMLRIVGLKIKFYRKNGKNGDYLKACGLYYELSERAEVENRTMMSSIINLRKNYEDMNREKKQVEIRNIELQEKSETDPLTQLNNRLRLNNYSETVFQHAAEKEQSLIVEILDIDNFKGFNDTYGHQAGDECLVKVAEVLKTMETEHNAFVSRYGGDEFVLIYKGISKEEAVIYAEELRRKIINLAIPHEKNAGAKCVTISQGLCWDVPVKGNKMWDFLHVADNMLYRVKQKQRNNYCVGNVKESEESFIIGKSWNS